MTDEQKLSIGKALGKIPSGVFILTATHGDRSAAMMVSWVQQAGFAPPVVTFAIARERPIQTLIQAGGLFALSILGKADNTLMKKYARGIPEGEDPFAAVSSGHAENGAIYLSDSLGYLECRLLKTCDFGGDHDLYIAEVISGKLLKDEASFTHTRGNGFHY